MSDGMRALATALDLILFALSCYRLHSVDADRPQFAFHATQIFAWGWLLWGDIDYWLAEIDLGAAHLMGTGMRLNIFRAVMLTGLLYLTVRDPRRCKEKKDGCKRTIR